VKQVVGVLLPVLLFAAGFGLRGLLSPGAEPVAVPEPPTLQERSEPPAISPVVKSAPAPEGLERLENEVERLSAELARARAETIAAKLTCGQEEAVPFDEAIPGDQGPSGIDAAKRVVESAVAASDAVEARVAYSDCSVAPCVLGTVYYSEGSEAGNAFQGLVQSRLREHYDSSVQTHLTGWSPGHYIIWTWALPADGTPGHVEQLRQSARTRLEAIVSDMAEAGAQDVEAMAEVMSQ